MSTAVRLRCHTPSQSQQFGGTKGIGAGGAIVSIHADGDGVIVIYADLKVGYYKWSPKNATNRLRPEKLKALQHRELSRSASVIKRGSVILEAANEIQPAVGNYSFGVTLGGYESEQKKRKMLMPSRLESAKGALYTDAVPVIVSCGYFDNTVKVHSSDGCRLERSENGGHRGRITCLATSHEDGFLVTGGEDCTCRIWVVDHPDMAVALSDGYTQTSLGRSTINDDVLSCCHVLWGHVSPISSVALSSRLDIAASGSLGGTICVHKLRTGEFVRSFVTSASPNEAVQRIALEQNGRMVIHTKDLRLHTYSVNGVCLSSVDAGEQINDMAITGEVVITGGDLCHVYIRNLSTLRVLSGLDLSRHGPIRCISLTPEELKHIPQHLFIGSDDGMISIVEHD
jgi:WD40 repeat protein